MLISTVVVTFFHKETFSLAIFHNQTFFHFFRLSAQQKAMAARIKSLAQLLLLSGVLSFLIASASGQDQVAVAFVIVQHVEYAEVIKIVGNTTELGNWNTSNGLKMAWNNYDYWTASTTLTKGATYEYRAVVVDDWDGTLVCYIPGSNRVLTVPEDFPNPVVVVTMVWKASSDNACNYVSAHISF